MHIYIYPFLLIYDQITSAHNLHIIQNPLILGSICIHKHRSLQSLVIQERPPVAHTFPSPRQTKNIARGSQSQLRAVSSAHSTSASTVHNDVGGEDEDLIERARRRVVMLEQTRGTFSASAKKDLPSFDSIEMLSSPSTEREAAVAGTIAPPPTSEMGPNTISKSDAATDDVFVDAPASQIGAGSAAASYTAPPLSPVADRAPATVPISELPPSTARSCTPSVLTIPEDSMDANSHLAFNTDSQITSTSLPPSTPAASMARSFTVKYEVR